MRKFEQDEKDMTVLREGDNTKTQMQKKHGVLKDYTLKHRVTIQWDLNDEAVRDRMFRLNVGGNEVILDAEELARFTRWI